MLRHRSQASANSNKLPSPPAQAIPTYTTPTQAITSQGWRATWNGARAGWALRAGHEACSVPEHHPGSAPAWPNQDWRLPIREGCLLPAGMQARVRCVIVARSSSLPGGLEQSGPASAARRASGQRAVPGATHLRGMCSTRR